MLNLKTTTARKEKTRAVVVISVVLATKCEGLCEALANFPCKTRDKCESLNLKEIDTFLLFMDQFKS